MLTLLVKLLIVFVLCCVCPQSWPLSLSGSSLRGGDVVSADLLTWWLDIPSSQRMSWSRPSSLSVALYVVSLTYSLFLLCCCCTVSIMVMMTDSAMHPVLANLCLFPPPNSDLLALLFPHRMFSLSCVTLVRKWVTSSWLTESQLRQRFAHGWWLQLYFSHKKLPAFKDSDRTKELCLTCVTGISPSWHSGSVFNKQRDD